MITKYKNKSGKRSICVCEYCKYEFETLDIKIREGKEKYCSKDCYNNFRCENKKDIKERNILYQKKNKYGLSEKRWWVLDFHHIDPTKKEKNLSNMIRSNSFKSVLQEIEKCIVLCSNCHRDLHYQEKI